MFPKTYGPLDDHCVQYNIDNFILCLPAYLLYSILVRPFPRVHFYRTDSTNNVLYDVHSPPGPAGDAQAQFHANIPHTNVISQEKDQEYDPGHGLESNQAPNEGCYSNKLQEPLCNVAHLLEDLIKALCIMGNQCYDVSWRHTREIFEAKSVNLRVRNIKILTGLLKN